eukprot:2509029-Rhodomonas_salina.1
MARRITSNRNRGRGSDLSFVAPPPQGRETGHGRSTGRYLGHGRDQCVSKFGTGPGAGASECSRVAVARAGGIAQAAGRMPPVQNAGGNGTVLGGNLNMQGVEKGSGSG